MDRDGIFLRLFRQGKKSLVIDQDGRELRNVRVVKFDHPFDGPPILTIEVIDASAFGVADDGE